jgi:PCFT/HCP family folate transporter-like MFS transporter 1/3
VTELSIYTGILSSLPGIFLCLLIGPWSDRHGRRALMVMPVFGCLLSQVVLVVNTYFEAARAEWILFTSVYSIFGGG